jgi:glycosyl transferase, family 25
MSAGTKVFSAVKVVSLPDARDRRDKFLESAATTDLPWAFFDACTGAAAPLAYDDAGARRVHGRVLQAGEIGTYATHFAAWQWLLDSEFEQMIVFEDDVVADWPMIAQLAHTDFSAMGIHYLRLFTKIPARWRKLKTPFFDRYHHLIRITSFALGTQAYLISREGAAKLVRHGAHIDCPVDAYMDKYWRHGVPNLALYPFPVFERFQPSTIGEARFEKEHLAALDRLALFSRRLRERFAMVRNALGFDPDGVERALLRRLP